MDYEKQLLSVRVANLETFMEAVCSRLKCLPDYNDSLPTKGNSHVINKLDALLKNIESPNSADVKPEVGAQPPKREYNTARDEICTDIISNCICDYCVHKPGMASDYCGDCSGGSEFVGRKLRPC
jgi:hypothetical protein